MAKVRIAGTWSGALEVELENWTVPMLRAEVARRSSCAPESLNLICSGKLLKDGDGSQKLSEVGLKNNAKILASRICAEEGKALKVELMAEDERARRLARVKAAATALSKRHADGSLPDEDYNLELENQSGNQIQLGSETDKRAIIMGLMLHAKAKQLIRMQKHEEALEVLAMGEEAFSLCNPDVIEGVDNVAILQIDMVWCYFMLRDISWLSEAGVRLDKARKGIERVHGKDAWRIRVVQAGRYPELALHLRLELLEGVIAYHSGQLEKSTKALTSAQEKFAKLQVRDGDLSFVMSMGYKEKDVKRALRMSNQDVGSAIDFLMEEKARRAHEREKNLQRRDEIMEQKRFGVTALKKAVDLQRLKELVSIGFEKELAAEALRKNENDSQKALDDLTNPEANSAIQVAIESRKRKREQQAADAAIEQLVHMGFERSRVVAAVQSGGNMEEAMQQLLTQQEPIPSASANNTSGSGNESNNAAIPPNATGLEGLSNGVNNNNSIENPSTSSEVEERDREMEDELADELAHSDALSDYDIEVTIEGEAIAEYLALLTSTGANGGA